MQEKDTEKQQIQHDRLFKELFHTFFIEFIEVFFPKLAKLVDKSYIKFLAQEVFTDITAGEKHIVDVLVETRLSGVEGFVLVHVESQSYRETDFNERMHKYFCRLKEKHGKIIVPIAVFSHDSSKEEDDSYVIKLPFLKVLEFNFLKLQLINKDWRKYIKSNNPAAAALMTRMNYSSKEAVKVKVQIARMIARMQLDPAKAALILVFSDTYIPLDEKQRDNYEQMLKKEMNHAEVNKYMQFTTYYHEQGRKEGIKEGIKEGKADSIINALKWKFSMEPEGLRDKLMTLPLDRLDKLVIEIMASQDIKSFMSLVEKELPKN